VSVGPCCLNLEQGQIIIRDAPKTH